MAEAQQGKNGLNDEKNTGNDAGAVENLQRENKIVPPKFHATGGCNSWATPGREVLTVIDSSVSPRVSKVMLRDRSSNDGVIGCNG